MQQWPLRRGPGTSSGSGLINSVKPVLIELSESLSYLRHFCAHRTKERRSLQSNVTNDKPLVLHCSSEDDF